jgi:signal transduction histidine kinase
MHATLVMVVAAFMGATLLSRHVANATHADAEGIARNGAPSIERLAAIRTSVLDLQLTLMSVLDQKSSQREAWLGKADDLLAAMEDDRAGYENLPVFPGESELWANARSNLMGYRRIALDAIAALHRQDWETARAKIMIDLPPATERTLRTVFSVIRLDSARVQELAQHIESERVLANRLAYVLGGLAMLLAAGLGIFTHRAIGRYAELQERHAEVLKERADELELFAARVAHDVMSPLGAASASIELAQRPATDRAGVEKALARSLRSIRRVAGVVQGLYEFARSGARPKARQSCRVPQVIEEVVEELRPLAREAALEITTSTFPEVLVACSSGVLGSLLSNLIGNAIKYSGGGSDAVIEVRVMTSDHTARFEVEDHGPGLPPGLVSSVFNPYIRGDEHRQPGLGLGLATVKRLSEGHGGACGVRSTPGRGCVFWFELPLRVAQEPQRFDHFPASESAPPPGG